MKKIPVKLPTPDIGSEPEVTEVKSKNSLSHSRFDGRFTNEYLTINEIATIASKIYEKPRPVSFFKSSSTIEEPYLKGMDSIDPDEEHDDEEGISYDNYADKVKKYLQLYHESKNNLYLYRLITLFYCRHLNGAIIHDASHPRADVDVKIIKDSRAIFEDIELTSADIKLTDIDFDVIRKFVEVIYQDTDLDKYFRVNVVSLRMCSDLVNKAARKGIIIDEEILEKIRTINFDELLYNGGCLELVYVHSINTLMYLDIHKGTWEMFVSLGHCHRSLNSLPDKTAEISIQNTEGMIEINGTKYVRKIFESIVESTLDNFIANLELETILNNKDIAEDNVVDVSTVKLL